MTVLLCRNRVADFSRWKPIFDSHALAHRQAGLHLRHMWRAIGDPDNVFFWFEVTDLAQARAFLTTPSAAEAEKDAGVLEADFHFLESTPGY